MKGTGLFSTRSGAQLTLHARKQEIKTTYLNALCLEDGGPSCSVHSRDES